MVTSIHVRVREGQHQLPILHYLYRGAMAWAAPIDIFTRSIYADVLIDSLKYCQQHKGLEVYAYVIMPFRPNPPTFT